MAFECHRMVVVDDHATWFEHVNDLPHSICCGDQDGPDPRERCSVLHGKPEGAAHARCESHADGVSCESCSPDDGARKGLFRPE